MGTFDEDRPRHDAGHRRGVEGRGLVAIGVFLLLGLGFVMALYNSFKFEVAPGQQAVLIRREGFELEPEMGLARRRRTATPTTRVSSPAARTTES